MKIAAVGAGLGGPAVAWLLCRRHEVTRFERHHRPGFPTHPVAVRGAAGAERVDMPLPAHP